MARVITNSPEQNASQTQGCFQHVAWTIGLVELAKKMSLESLPYLSTLMSFTIVGFFLLLVKSILKTCTPYFLQKFFTFVILRFF